jgi:hypothetical protein
MDEKELFTVLGKRVAKDDGHGLIRLESHLFSMDGKLIYFKKTKDLYDCYYKQHLAQDVSFNELLFHKMTMDEINKVCSKHGLSAVYSRDYKPDASSFKSIKYGLHYFDCSEYPDAYCMVIDDSYNIQNDGNNIQGNVFRTQEAYDAWCIENRIPNNGKLNAIIDARTAIANHLSGAFELYYEIKHTN